MRRHWLAAAFVLALGATLPAVAAPMCRGTDGYAADFGGRRTFLLRPDVLERLKGQLADDPAINRAFAGMMGSARAALENDPPAVTDKTAPPPSGDLHDYTSLAIYWWPDPSQPSGLPYVQRDGEINPERYSGAYDVARLAEFDRAVAALSLAYYYTDDERYARRAAVFLRRWFLDPATRMNPNLRYAQIVPGTTSFRYFGSIDTVNLLPVVEAIGLIHPSGALSAEEEAGLQSWFGAYAEWLKTSDEGRQEAGRANNHGLWYDAQVMDFALFAGRLDIAGPIAERFAADRIDQQFAADGTLPAEVARAQSLHYSIYAVLGAYAAAGLAQCLGVDLWNHETPDGGSIRAATDAITPYFGREADWPHGGSRVNRNEFNEFLLQAAVHWPDAGYPVPSGGWPVSEDYMPRPR